MTRTSKLAAVLLLVCVACSNVKETPKGLKYTVVRKGDGVVGKPGQYLIASVVFKDSKDSVWFDTRKVEFPAPIVIPDTSAMKREDGIEEIFRLLSKGDSISFSIPAKNLYEKTFHQPLPPKMDPNGAFSFQISVKDIITQEQYTKLQKEMTEKQNEKAKQLAVAQLGKDTVSIDSFLVAKNIKAMKTASGVRYEITKAGTGPKVTAGQNLKLWYAGRLLNGTYFDTNIESVAKAHNMNRPGYKPMELAAGKGRIIPGLDEAVMLMNKGSKMTVYIPSTLAYGNRKVSPEIGANAIMIFDVELIDLK